MFCFFHFDALACRLSAFIPGLTNTASDDHDAFPSMVLLWGKF